MERTKDRDVLAKYIPASALDKITFLLQEHTIRLHIKSARKTKLGDFRPEHNGKPAKITMNADLNKYAFLITLIHEIAHWLVWVAHKNTYTIKPHGSQWKQTYSNLMYDFLVPEIFPEEVLFPLIIHMRNPKASSSSDKYLLKALKNHNKHKTATLLDDLQIGDQFSFNHKNFEVTKINRSRFICTDLSNGKTYSIHSMAEVERVIKV